MSNDFRMFRQCRHIIRRCSVKSALKTHDCTSSLQRVGECTNHSANILVWFSAKLYNDLESRLYAFDESQGNSEDMKIFLAGENQRIEGELLEMNKFEVKMASSIMSKKLFLRKVQPVMIRYWCLVCYCNSCKCNLQLQLAMQPKMDQVEF